MDARQLGRTGIPVTPIGLGCMQFSGAGPASQVFAPLPQETVDAVVRAALDGGVGWCDTAEVYGHGRSERALTSALAAAGIAPGQVGIATKWLPTGRTAGNIPRTIDRRLEALQGYPIDLYQIHEPYSSIGSVRAQLAAMARLQRDGRIRAVGVSNFSARRMTRAAATLEAAGSSLASNQVQINLLQRAVERNGVLDAARALGVTLIAYSPLAGGLLTGRFHEDPAALRRMRPLRRFGRGGWFSPSGLARTAPLIAELRAIGDAYGVTVAQVALNWLITAYGDTVVAIPGASRPGQAREAAGAMAFRLTAHERARIEERLP